MVRRSLLDTDVDAVAKHPPKHSLRKPRYPLFWVDELFEDTSFLGVAKM